MRASDLVYARLRSEIIEWALIPGRPLGEIETADRLGVSRTPVREALSRLVAEGLATNVGRTVHVAPLSRALVIELYELREALEIYAAKLAARRRDPKRFERLLYELRRGPGDGDELVAHRPYYLADELEAAIDEAAGSRFIRASLEDLRGQMARVSHHSRSNPARMEKVTEEHIQIAEAIWLGDESLAMGATAVHLHNSLSNILDSLPSLVPEK
ncbi:MAG: GntR family transcriptional regulator [Rhodococcus sp.]|nr:GntR family transcriptional regulator [Rhodococcus sp. (in: high G+C Gram-positive bacteria)]